MRALPLPFLESHPRLRDYGLPLAICVAYFLTMSFYGQSYVLANYDNSDFYSRYVPDALRIARGVVPEDTFVGPGYATLLMFVAGLVPDDLAAGKWIAITTASLCGLLAFYLFKRLFGYRAALLSLPIVLVSGDFAVCAIDPGTDMPFLLFCIATLLLFTDNRMQPNSRAALAGAFAALAYLTRYNGLFLPATFVVALVLLNAFDQPIRQRIKSAAIHLLSFVAVASPWLYLNYINHGSALYNTNYLNMATESYGYRTDWDGVVAVKQLFHGFGDVVMHDPKHFATHYAVNLIDSLRNSLTTKLAMPPIGVLAWAGAVWALFQRPWNKDVIVLLLSVAAYFGIMAFGHWEDRYYLYVMVCYVGLAGYFAVASFDWLCERFTIDRAVAFTVVAGAALLVFAVSARDARKDIKRLLATQPVELIPASERLKSMSPSGATIMARKPHLAYLTGSRATFFPQVQSLDELEVAAKEAHADFLLYDKTTLALRPNVAMLADPDNHIAWLSPVYSDRSRSLVLYRVTSGLPAGGASSIETLQ